MLIIPNRRRGGYSYQHACQVIFPSTPLDNLALSAVKTEQQIPVVIVLARHPGCRVGVNTVTPAFSKPNALERNNLNPMHSETN